jgi:hypothetical protein
MSEKSFIERVSDLSWIGGRVDLEATLQIAKEADEERTKTRELLMGVYSVAKHALAIARSYVSDGAAGEIRAVLGNTDILDRVRDFITGDKTDV